MKIGDTVVIKKSVGHPNKGIMFVSFVAMGTPKVIDKKFFIYYKLATSEKVMRDKIKRAQIKPIFGVTNKSFRSNELIYCKTMLIEKI